MVLSCLQNHLTNLQVFVVTASFTKHKISKTYERCNVRRSTSSYGYCHLIYFHQSNGHRFAFVVHANNHFPRPILLFHFVVQTVSEIERLNVWQGSWWLESRWIPIFFSQIAAGEGSGIEIPKCDYASEKSWNKNKAFTSRQRIHRLIFRGLKSYLCEMIVSKDV